MGESQNSTGIGRTPAHLTACLLFLLLSLTACQTTPSPADRPVFEIKAEGDGNTVELLEAGDTTVFDVRSESGIGRAAVRLTSGQAPHSIHLRLHLTGLEEFKLSYEATVLRATASGNSRRVTEHLLVNGGEQEINSLSPHWMVIDPSTGEGFFEIALPRDYFRNGSGEFSFEWVDFFR